MMNLLTKVLIFNANDFVNLVFFYSFNQEFRIPKYKEKSCTFNKDKIFNLCHIPLIEIYLVIKLRAGHIKY